MHSQSQVHLLSVREKHKYKCLYLKNVQSSEITTNLIREGLLIISNYLRASANQAIITSNSHGIDVFIVGSNNTSSFQINGLFGVL